MNFPQHFEFVFSAYSISFFLIAVYLLFTELKLYRIRRGKKKKQREDSAKN